MQEILKKLEHYSKEGINVDIGVMSNAGIYFITAEELRIELKNKESELSFNLFDSNGQVI